MSISNAERIRGELKKYDLCDEDCNHCPIVGHKNTLMVYRMLSVLEAQFPTAFGQIALRCTNLTVCPVCRCDDFTHVEGCKVGDWPLFTQGTGKDD